MNDIETLKEKLHEGEVNFEYTKKDGTIRKARGTLDMGMIPESQHPVFRPTAPDNVRYWDLDAQGWRSFRPENFLRIVEDSPNEPSQYTDKPSQYV